MHDVKELWESGRCLEAGRVIFERLAPMSRPKWACAVLRLMVQRTHVRHAAIEAVLSLAERPAEWKSAHRVFCALRSSTLEAERRGVRSAEQELIRRILYLAENTAKVLYNATDPPDEFDEDSGWWVAPCLKDVLDWYKDEELTEAAWEVISSPA